MKSQLAVLLSALLLATLHPASAAVLAFEEAGTSQGLAGQGIAGFNFTLDSPISVTSLGFFGMDMGGIDTPWVAIYDVTNNVQVASITTYLPNNGWQYLTLVTPVVLSPGVTYQVVATAYWTPQYTNTASFTFGPEINPIGFTTAPGVWTGWGTPTMATAPITTTANVTANFQYDPVPEPSTVLLACGGLATALFFRRRAS
jgi:hypothetical protein